MTHQSMTLDGVLLDGKTQVAGKTSNVWRLALAVAVAAMLSPFGAVAAQGGTDIMHFTSKSDMLNTQVEPEAVGKAEVDLNSQGNVENQQLKIAVSKLNPHTTYRLTALVGNDTNATDVAGFTTDKKGAFTISYSKKIPGNSSPHGELLPDVLDPLCNVRELDIVNGSTNTVLGAILSNPDSGKYMVKSSMNPVGFIPAAVGDFRIGADSKSTKFQLKASGLASNTDYSLMFNGVIAQTYTSDASGKLTVNQPPLNSPDVLTIQTVALSNGPGTNLVLITVGIGIPCTQAHQLPVSLGAGSAAFTVLAGSTVANTGFTTVNGDLGLSPGSAVTGFPPGIVTGDVHVDDTTADQAKLDLTTAYNDAAGRTVGAVTIAGNLGGLTLPPGFINQLPRWKYRPAT